MTKFDAMTLDELRKVGEVAIRTAKHPGSAVTIWVAVADDEVFIRSFRGANGRWYKDLAAGGSATLEYGRQQLAVRAVPVSDGAVIARASREYLRKYQPSSYARAMVQSDILTTTLRLEPH